MPGYPESSQEPGESRGEFKSALPLGFLIWGSYRGYIGFYGAYIWMIQGHRDMIPSDGESHDKKEHDMETGTNPKP